MSVQHSLLPEKNDVATTQQQRQRGFVAGAQWSVGEDDIGMRHILSPSALHMIARKKFSAKVVGFSAAFERLWVAVPPEVWVFGEPCSVSTGQATRK